MLCMMLFSLLLSSCYILPGELGGEIWSQKSNILIQSVLFILSFHWIIQYSMKRKLKRRKQTMLLAPPLQISLPPGIFAFLEERVLFSSSIFIKTAKLIENILFPQCLCCKTYDRKQRFFFLSHEGKRYCFYCGSCYPGCSVYLWDLRQPLLAQCVNKRRSMVREGELAGTKVSLVNVCSLSAQNTVCWK